jgi:hypothetical protein
MRRFVLYGLVVLMIIATTGIIGTNADEKESFELNIGNAEIITTIEGEEFFIPVATGNHIIWGQKDGKATNLMSCDISTGKTEQINRGSFSHIYDIYPGKMVSVSNGWVAFLKSSIVSDGDVLVCKADGTVPLKSVTTENCTKTSYPIFHGDNLYFWQNCINDEPSGVYRYSTKADETVLLYETEKSTSGLFKIRTTDDHILLIDFSYSGNATLLDSTGKLIKTFDYSDDDITDNNIKKATFYDIFGDTILFDRHEATIDEDKKSIVSLNSFFTYDISDDEVVELGPTSEIGSTTNCVRISPEIFSFIHAKEIRDLNPETREYDFTMNVLSADTSIKNMTYNAPITQKYETRSNHYSSIWNNYIVYPGGDDPDNWYVNLYDAKNETEYQITEKPGAYHYPTINEGIITYFLERPTDDGYDLIVHRIEELEPAGEQGDVNRELELEDGVVCVDPKNPINWFKSLDEYLVWTELDDSKSYLKSYSFESKEVFDLVECRQRSRFDRQPSSLLSDDYYAIEEENVDTLGTKVSVGKLDGTNFTQIKNDKALSVSLLAIKNDKVYVFQDFAGDKLDGIFEYDITSGKTEFLFDPNQKIKEFHLVGDCFVISSNFESIIIYDKDGEIIRVLAPEENKNTEYSSFNSVDEIFGEYIIFKIHRYWFKSMDDYYSYDRDYCFNVITGGLWDITDLNFTSANYNNPDIFLSAKYIKSDDKKRMSFSIHTINLKTRKNFEIKNVKTTNSYRYHRYSFVSVYESLVASYKNVPVDEDESTSLENIILYDTIAEKEYQVTETPGNFKSLYLSKDRISYLEDNQIISHKIVKVEDSQ